jgi:hypothetical protein
MTVFVCLNNAGSINRTAVTSEEKDSLNFVINEQKPRPVFIESCFYEAVTPYMTGRLLRDFPKLRIVPFSVGEFPDDLAMWFYFHGVKIISTSGTGCANSSGVCGKFCGVRNSVQKKSSGVLICGEDFRKLPTVLPSGNWKF